VTNSDPAEDKNTQEKCTWDLMPCCSQLQMLVFPRFVEIAQVSLTTAKKKKYQQASGQGRDTEII